MPNDKPSRFNPHFFARDPDGGVRLRLRFTADEATKIEEGAGATPLLIYIHRVLAARAEVHIRKRKEEAERLGISPDSIPFDEDAEEADDQDEFADDDDA